MKFIKIFNISALPTSLCSPHKLYFEHLLLPYNLGIFLAFSVSWIDQISRDSRLVELHASPVTHVHVADCHALVETNFLNIVIKIISYTQGLFKHHDCSGIHFLRTVAYANLFEAQHPHGVKVIAIN